MIFYHLRTEHIEFLDFVFFWDTLLEQFIVIGFVQGIWRGNDKGFGLWEKREFWGTGIGRSFVGIKGRSVDLRLVDHISGVSNLRAPTCRPPWKPKVLNRLRPWPCSLLLFSDICYLSTYHCFCFAFFLCCLECSSDSGDPAMTADGKYLPKRVTQNLKQQQKLQDT